MTTYTVHIPPNGRPEQARFLPDGVNIAALIFPLIWLVWHRLWLELTVYVAFLIATGLATQSLNFVSLALTSLPGLYLFIEGNQLVQSRLRRKGWEMSAIVEADNLPDAETKYFADDPSIEELTPTETKPAPVPIAIDKPDDGAGIGLFLK